MLSRAAGETKSPTHLFIIGAARSGTRLLRDLIGCHPDVASVPYDVNYLWRLGNYQLPHDELTPDLLSSEIRDRIASRLDRYRQGRRLLVEKTVSNSLRVPFVAAAFDQALYINLVRDPLDVAESSYRQWVAMPKWKYIFKKAMGFPIIDAFGYASRYARQVVARSLGRAGASTPTWGPRYEGIDEDLASLSVLEVCAIQVLRCVRAAEAGLLTVPDDRRMVIRYEEFVRDPTHWLRVIWEFAALRPDLVDVEDACKRVTSDSIGRGCRALGEEDRDKVLRHVGELRAALGYTTPCREQLADFLLE